MKRREFLVGTAAGLAGLGAGALAQSGQAPAAGGAPGRAGAAPGRGAGGRGAGPAAVPEWKLARVSIMTYNFSSMLKLPWNTAPNANQTLDLMDLPQYYIDTYGVHNVEFQHSHLAQGQNDPDPAFMKEIRAKLDALKSTATQINIETGNLGGMDAAASKAWVESTKKWTDAALILGVKRLMLNQGMLNADTKASVIATWKEAVAYAKPKDIMISAETRGGGGAANSIPAWKLLEEVIEASGGHSNIDIGGAGAPNQEALNEAIKGMYPTSSGNMHIKSSPNWDIGAAVRYTESLGYTGRYSIEVSPDAIRIVYNTILANVKNMPKVV